MCLSNIALTTSTATAIHSCPVRGMPETAQSDIKTELATIAAAHGKVTALINQEFETEPTCSCSGTAKPVVGFDMSACKVVCKACADTSHATVPVGGSAETTLGLEAVNTARQEVLDTVNDAANDPATAEDLAPDFIKFIERADNQPGTGANFRGSGAPKNVCQAVRATNKLLGSMSVDVNSTYGDVVERKFINVVKTENQALSRHWAKAKAARISRKKLAPIVAAALALQDLDN